MKPLFLILALVFLIGVASALPFASAQSSAVPQWVKNNADWWAEGKISEQEYLNAIEFLVENKIIDIGRVFPSTIQTLVLEKHKANKSVLESRDFSNDETFLTAIQVKIGGGDFTEELIVDTFGRFNVGKDNTLLTQLRQDGYASYFVLESLPSKDKADFYKLLSMYVNPGREPLPFDVAVSGIMSDGTTLLTQYYKKCQIEEYSIYLEDLKIVYQYTNMKQDEIRDKIIFLCGGLAIGEIVTSFPQIDFADAEDLEDNSTKDVAEEHYVVPYENDRAMYYVVHFFDGEIEKLRSFGTFKVFTPQNVLNPSPQFSLESLPSKDKKGFYDLLSRYINPVKIPERFKVSVDMVSGDGTILQRWNYAKCEVIDYTMELEEYIFRYAFSGDEASEIIDKTDFKCGGLNLKVHGHDKIDEIPTAAVEFQKASVFSKFSDDSLKQEDRAMSYSIDSFGGEFEDSRTHTDFQKFESLSWKRPSIPANHAKQYEYAFVVESNPSKDKAELYEFYSRYVNAGKPPEPFYANVNILTGDKTVLHTLKFTKCSAMDFDWYYQEFLFFYPLAGVPSPETRERYTIYCEGLTVEVP